MNIKEFIGILQDNGASIIEKTIMTNVGSITSYGLAISPPVTVEINVIQVTIYNVSFVRVDELKKLSYYYTGVGGTILCVVDIDSVKNLDIYKPMEMR